MGDSSSAASGGALRTLSFHTIIYLVGQMASRVAAFLLLPIFTPRLTREDYGRLEIADFVLLLALQIVGFQLDAALTRFHARAGDPEHKRDVVTTCFRAVTLLACLAGGALYAAAEPVARAAFGSSADAPLVRLVAIVLAATCVVEVALSVLKAEQRSMANTTVSLVRLVLELCAKIALVVGFGLGAFGVLAGQAGVAALGALLAASWLGVRHRGRFDRALLRELVVFSAPMVLSGLCQFALHTSDRWLLKSFCGLADTGLYGIGYKFGYAVNAVVLSAFLLIWYPFIFAVKDDAERRTVLGRALTHVPALVTAMSLPLALLSPEIVRGFTDEHFHDAWRFVPAVAFAYVFWAAFQIAQTPFYVHGKTRSVPRLVLIGATVNIGLNLMLLPTIGVDAAAWTTAIALAVLAGETWVSASRLEAMRVRATAVIAPLVCWIGALAACYAIDLGSRWSLPLRAGLALVAPIVLFFVQLDAVERAQVIQLVRSSLRRGGSTHA